MRFKMLVRHVGQSEDLGWLETFDRTQVIDDETAELAGRALVKWYNDTLRPGERPREFVRIHLIGPTLNGVHEWEKVSLVTERVHGTYADRMKCKACGAKGYRIGLSGNTLLEPAEKRTLCNPTYSQYDKDRTVINANLTAWYDSKRDGNPGRDGLYHVIRVETEGVGFGTFKAATGWDGTGTVAHWRGLNVNVTQDNDVGKKMRMVGVARTIDTSKDAHITQTVKIDAGVSREDLTQTLQATKPKRVRVRLDDDSPAPSQTQLPLPRVRERLDI